MGVSFGEDAIWWDRITNDLVSNLASRSHHDVFGSKKFLV